MSTRTDLGSISFSYVDQPGGRVYVADAFYPVRASGSGSEFKKSMLAITPDQLGRRSSRGQSTAIAQFYEIVQNGLILALHVFRGLKRPCCSGDDMGADKSKLVYVWTPAFDAIWKRERFQGAPSRCQPPSSAVFAVYVSPNGAKQEFPDVSGWIEHWAWLDEDDKSPGRPVKHETRYDEHLWSRG